MSIQTNAMTVNISISLWAGHKLDRDASKNVTETANAEAGAARVNKHLVPKDALAPINTAAGAIRLHYYNKTLPWKDNGDRLLTRKMYRTFMQEHRALVERFEAAVDHFVTVTYPIAYQRAEFRMGDLFNARDYPDAEDIRHKFKVRLDIDAVTEANDFRVGLDSEERDAIKGQIESGVRDRLRKAVGDVWERLHTTLQHFHERMSNKDSYFKEGTVTNLHEIIEMLPALNVLDDPHLTEIGESLRGLSGLDAKELRKDERMREAVAGEAKVILATMSGFMAVCAGVNE